MLVAHITSHSHDPLGPRGPLDPGRPLVPGGPAQSAGSPGSPAGPFSPDSPFIPNGPNKSKTDRENGNVLFLAFGLNSVLKQFFKCSLYFGEHCWDSTFSFCSLLKQLHCYDYVLFHRRGIPHPFLFLSLYPIIPNQCFSMYFYLS